MLSEPRLDAWNDLVSTIVPGFPLSWHGITYFVPLVLLITSLLVPHETLPHNALATLVMPVIIGCTIHAWIVMGSLDVISVDTLWWSFFFLVFRDPRKDFRRLVEPHGTADTRAKKGNRNGRKQGAHENMTSIVDQGYPKDFLSRVRWVMLLTQERPLTSWKTGEPSHDAKVLPPHVRQSRWTFIRSLMIVLMSALVITMPLAQQLKSSDIFFHQAGLPLDLKYFENDSIDRVGQPSRPLPDQTVPNLPPIPQIVGMLQSLLPRRILRPLTLGLYLYSLMILLFLPPFIIPVMLTFLLPIGHQARWSPHTWPRPHFGPFSSVLDHGLRGLWGQWWHQQMRYAVSEPGRWVAKKLGLKGLGRYAVICMSAFLLSGITHAGLVPARPRFAELYGPLRLRLMLAAFFWVQPVGILLELMLMEPLTMKLSSAVPLYGRLRQASTRILRLCWVLLFMSSALVFLLDPFIELGYWKIWPPFFLSQETKSLSRGDWLP